VKGDVRLVEDLVSRFPTPKESYLSRVFNEGEVLQRPPPLGGQGETALAQAAHPALKPVGGVVADSQGRALDRLSDGGGDADPRSLYPASAKVRRPLAAACSAPRTWARAAGRSCTDPGPTWETKSGNPSGPIRPWTLPPWVWAFPEYHRSISLPLALVIFSEQRPVGMTIPLKMRVQSVVLVGSSDSRTVAGRFFAPRGYTWGSAAETVP
jgi:hypothetical protein